MFGVLVMMAAWSAVTWYDDANNNNSTVCSLCAEVTSRLSAPAGISDKHSVLSKPVQGVVTSCAIQLCKDLTAYNAQFNAIKTLYATLCILQCSERCM